MKRICVLTRIAGLLLAAGVALAESADDTAFQQLVKLDVPDSSSFAFASYTVPPGKRLIIRYLAAWATLPSGQRLTTTIQTTVHELTAEFPQTYTTQVNGDGTDDLVSTQQVRLKADGDTTVYFQVFRRGARGAIRVSFAISGDLVPAP